MEGVLLQSHFQPSLDMASMGAGGQRGSLGNGADNGKPRMHQGKGKHMGGGVVTVSFVSSMSL